jgi:integrase
VPARSGGNYADTGGTEARLGYLLGDVELSTLDVKELQALYDSRQKQVAVDTHRRELIEVKAFLKFCARRRWLSGLTIDELREVEPMGQLKCGADSKLQLHLDEARRWLQVALEMTDSDAISEREGALASMLCPVMGMRPGEVRNLQVRDVDDGGRLLWAAARGGKTRNARRTLEVPELLRPLLLRQARGAVRPPALWRNDSEQWVRRWTKKICRRAGVPVVNPQGNRGLHASIAREAGATGHVVMKQLGHGAESVHERHYAAEGAVAQGNVRRLSEVLQGGR